MKARGVLLSTNYCCLGQVFPGNCSSYRASEAVKGQRAKEFLGAAVKEIVLRALDGDSAVSVMLHQKGKE